MHVLGEFKGARAIAGHAAFEDEVRKIGFAEQLGFFLTEAQDGADESSVVPGAGAADAGAAYPHLAADGFVIDVLHHGNHARGLQGQAPGGGFRSAVAFGFGFGEGGGFRAVRQAGQLGFIGEDEFPAVGGIEDVFRILLGHGGQFGFDFLQALFFVRREVGSAGAEIGEGFLEVAFLDAGQGFGFRGVGVGFEQVPERLVHHELGVEGRDLRQHFIVGFAQGRGVADRIQMADLAPGFAEAGGAGFEGEEGVFKSHAAAVGAADRIHPGLGVGEGGGDVRNDGVRGQGGPADMQGGIEERGHEVEGRF